MEFVDSLRPCKIKLDKNNTIQLAQFKFKSPHLMVDYVARVPWGVKFSSELGSNNPTKGEFLFQALVPENCLELSL